MFGLFEKVKKEDVVEKSPIKKDLVVLMILDGLGVHHDRLGNAVLHAETPFLDRGWTFGRSTLLHASGTHVGLPAEEPGNSEVGHINIGSGQVVYQSLPRINDAIQNGQFDKLDVFKEMIDYVKQKNSKLHLVGILSAGGVHGHIEHLFHIIDVCKKVKIEPYIHAILDGRDTGMTDGYFYLSKLVQKLKDVGIGKISSVMGRFYGMDRDNRWERTKLAYEAMVGIGQRTSQDPFLLVQEAYKKDENDQIFIPTTMVDTDGKPVGAISNGDAVLFYNFREDRARQLTKVFVLKDLPNIERVNFPTELYFATMTGYEESLPVHVIFPPKKIHSTLSSVLSENRMNQLHITETEKYMHVTYFFNGGVEKPHPGEDFFNIPSPRVFDYSNTPEMSAEIIKDEIIYRLNNLDKKRYSFIIANFANPDMLGHTGNIPAAVKAIEVVDRCAKEISWKVLEKGGAVIMVADHGNCETMIDRITKKVDTSHTNNPVPFIVLNDLSEISNQVQGKLYKVGTGDKAQLTGILADIAPTILNILDVQIPESMTGIDLLTVI